MIVNPMQMKFACIQQLLHHSAYWNWPAIVATIIIFWNSTPTATTTQSLATLIDAKDRSNYSNELIRLAEKEINKNNKNGNFTAISADWFTVNSSTTKAAEDILQITISQNTANIEVAYTTNNGTDGNSTVVSLSSHGECLANRNSISHILTILLYCVVCIVGLFGNSLVIYVVLRFSKMQTVTNVYILNLAAADECFLVGIPFLLYTMRICSWTFGDYTCKAYMVSTSITQFTSSIFLLIMAADRYVAICHPIESQKYRTLRCAKFVSIIAWLTSAVLMMPVILFASTIQQEDEKHFSCNIDWPEAYRENSGTFFILYTFLLGFAIPLCFILVFYYLVIRKLRSVQKKHKSKDRKKSHRKVTRMVLTVITVYILCWLPHWVSQLSLISSFINQRELSRVEILLYLLFGCLAYSNSTMNPLLYAFLSDNFRKCFTTAFLCIGKRELDGNLEHEHSVFTPKRSSSTNRRKNSKLVSASKSHLAVTNDMLSSKAIHNCTEGSSTLNSTSTATTATDRTSNSTKHSDDKNNLNPIIACAAV